MRTLACLIIFLIIIKVCNVIPYEINYSYCQEMGFMCSPERGKSIMHPITYQKGGNGGKEINTSISAKENKFPF